MILKIHLNEKKMAFGLGKQMQLMNVEIRHGMRLVK
jgi:hypothetical protein